MQYLVQAAMMFGLLSTPSLDHTDESILASLEHQIADEELDGVEVTVTDGRVQLSGSVRSLWEKRRASEIAFHHHHIDSVENRLEVRGGESDASVAGDIAERLRNYVHYTIYDDVRVTVQNGVATLDGKVTWGYKSREMERMASRVPGVQEIRNRIEVLPNSANDQQIRTSIATRIYGDPMFVRYSSQRTPPIHVVVDGGRVTLTGFVQSRIEKRRAEILARDAFGVFSVSNELRLDNAESE